MSETLAIVGGIAVGAIVAPLLVLIAMALFYKAKGPEGWDMATPLLTMMAMAAAVLVGAVSGIGVTRLFLEGRSQSAWAGIALSVVLVLAMPAYLFALPHLASGKPPRPADARARTRWARRTAAHSRHSDAHLWEQPGLWLAHHLWRVIPDAPAPLADSILARHGHDLKKPWIGLDPDERAAMGGYRYTDPGWRWEVVSDSPPRVLVVPDPLMGLGGPVFDVQPHRILRRAHRDAPGFAVDRTVAAVAAVRRRLVTVAAEAARVGQWDGSVAGLRPLLEARGKRGGERPLTWLAGDARPDGSWSFRTPASSGWTGAVVEVEVRPATGAVESPFEMAFSWLEVGYLVDAAGRWHAREGAPATADDPPPPPCLVDPAVPCD